MIALLQLPTTDEAKVAVERASAIPTDSRELADAELRRNPLYSKFPEDRKEWYIKQSLMLGTEAADRQLEHCTDILKLVKENGIKLVRRSECSAGKQSALRSEIEYREDECTITVYMDSIRSLYANCHEFAPPGIALQADEIFEMHVAHEFYHYLEFISGKTTSQRLPKIEIAWLGKFRRHIELEETCEIAAQAFAKRFCGLKVLPTYYDVLLIKTHGMKVCNQM
jgi:hypothetical protein